LNHLLRCRLDLLNLSCDAVHPFLKDFMASIGSALAGIGGIGGVLTFVPRVILQATVLATRSAVARWRLDSKMDRVNRSFQKVRNELCEVGLLDDGVYLDCIDLEVALLPSLGEAGYVMLEAPKRLRMLGFREGVIYLPGDIPDLRTHIPGGNLADTIRHEYGHCWQWLDPEFFEGAWYEKAFSFAYTDTDTVPAEAWVLRKRRGRDFLKRYKRLRTESGRDKFLEKELLKDFVSQYASTQSREDFAETFMLYLRHRKNLGKFRARPGVYRKLLAVERAVKSARRRLGL